MELADAQAFVARIIRLEVFGFVAGGPGGVISLELAHVAAPADQVRWYLGVDSAWRLEDRTALVTAWTDPNDEDGSMFAGLRGLVGNVIADVKILAPCFDLDVRFENGKRLFVFADTRDEARNCWFLIDPDERAVNAGPAGRIDFEL